MLGPIIEILFGLAVWKILPGFIQTTKKKKKKVAFWCNVVGGVIVILGGIHLVTSILNI